MKTQITHFLIAGFIFIGMQRGVNMEECIFENLDGDDGKFCRGNLQVVYPELGDVGCTYIPKCNQYRKRISKEWGSPDVIYQEADASKRYILIMVDPDAPNRAKPKFRFWRHWTVVDILGADLKKGKLKGRVLSDYRRPTPPSQSGFHRYQFLLYEQPLFEAISLNPEENQSTAISGFPEESSLSKRRISLLLCSLPSL
ncbi:phosphatidylethanolamine-binding protein 4 isoform X2 [Anolis carolinensis]|uniref:phosphatidylethanolamine-binding protein 4 isoform X2 n=1 Tax=Anolis carolinensis TaxID=28377 RepID=UPI002F2B54FE